MTAQEIYERETGNVAPNHQIAYEEWHINYVQWLQRQVEKQYNQPGDKLKIPKTEKKQRVQLNEGVAEKKEPYAARYKIDEDALSRE